jgi:hypothetical protein
VIFYTHHLVRGLGHPLRIDQEPQARSISLFPSSADAGDLADAD